MENEWTIPGEYVEEGLQMALTTYLFGVPIMELSRDELLSGLAHMVRSQDRHYQQSEAEREMYKLFLDAAKMRPLDT